MKRKLIAQGNGGFTISLPKKWIKENKIHKGDELKIFFNENSLIINNEKNRNNINIIAKSDLEVLLRIKLANAYRKGFKSITLKTEKFTEKEIIKFVEDYFFNFEVFKLSKNEYLIEEEILENNLEFDEVFKKYIFLNKLLYKQIFKFNLDNLIKKIQKYDNLIKRLVSKTKMPSQKNFYIWTILTQILFSSREVYHLNKIKIDSKNKLYYEIILEISELGNSILEFFSKNELINSEELVIKSKNILNKLNSEPRLDIKFSNSSYTLVKHLYLLINSIEGYHMS